MGEKLIRQPKERERLLKLGKVIGRAIEELITIVAPATFYRWVRDDMNGKGQSASPRRADGLTALVVGVLAIRLDICG
jgi:hypothetical protein